MKCTAIPRGHISNVFAEVKPYFDRAVERSRGRMGTDDLLRMVLTGESDLWIAYDEDDGNRMLGIVVTTIKTYPHKRMVDMTFCAGVKLDSWCSLLFTTIQEWAQSNNFDGLEFVGRAGWRKVLAKHGMKETYRLFELEF